MLASSASDQVSTVAEQTLRPLRAGEIRLRVHGRHDGGSGDEVPAAVFAQKLTILVRALRAADAAVNGRVNHEYVISDLRIGSALVELREADLSSYDLIGSHSGVGAFDECVDAIRTGSIERAQDFGKCPSYVSQLAKGSGRRFGYAELWIRDESPLRVDEFLWEQTEAVISPSKYIAELEAAQQWYKGIAQGSFEGEVKEVDLRGALPEVKLVLTAGGKELDCVFRDVDIDRIREALNRKVRVEGTAFYDGRSGLPRRVEVTAVHPIGDAGDFRRWRGTFEVFEPPPWENEA
jgi:hypothetical protein